MKDQLSALRVNPARLHNDFDQLAEIGKSEDGGVNRPTFSESHLKARAWFSQKIFESGLKFHQDKAGNHSAVLSCGPPDAPNLLLGSHLDSVPNGGRFDGALGVLCALEVLRVVDEQGLMLPVNLEAIDFTDEEGTVVGLLGSSALAGKLKTEDLQTPRGGRKALLNGLQRAGLTERDLLEDKRPAERLAGYLEVHIEQGTKLLKAGAEVGIVTGIVGISSYRLSFSGRADHAGTMPTEERLDAGQGAAAFTQSVRRIVLKEFPGCTANVGAMSFIPGAFNIVPERADLSLEVRASDKESLQRLEARLLTSARMEADRYGLGLEVQPLGKHQPAPMSELAQKAIARAAEDLGLNYIYLASGAGHDAQSLVGLCPCGMIFIPSVGGISHSPREFSEWKDCLNGANSLLQAALQLAFADQ
jgi:N-carbamoyl-L-amino-acid hydrolase